MTVTLRPTGVVSAVWNVSDYSRIDEVVVDPDLVALDGSTCSHDAMDLQEWTFNKPSRRGTIATATVHVAMLGGVGGELIEVQCLSQSHQYFDITDSVAWYSIQLTTNKVIPHLSSLTVGVSMYTGSAMEIDALYVDLEIVAGSPIVGNCIM